MLDEKKLSENFTAKDMKRIIELYKDHPSYYHESISIMVEGTNNLFDIITVHEGSIVSKEDLFRRRMQFVLQRELTEKEEAEFDPISEIFIMRFYYLCNEQKELELFIRFSRNHKNLAVLYQEYIEMKSINKFLDMEDTGQDFNGFVNDFLLINRTKN